MADVRPIALFGNLALAVALGSLVAGHFVLLPALASDVSLIDANLARSLAEPLARTCASLILLACTVMAALAKPWVRHRLALSVSLIAVSVAALDRVVLLPKVQAAWARVDLVAGRPMAKVDEAVQLQQAHEAALVLLLVALVGFAMLATARPAGFSGPPDPRP